MGKKVKIFNSITKAEEALPLNHPKKVVISGYNYCFVRTAKSIRAFSDFCPHQRDSLSNGKVTGFGEIVCPLHHYRFNLELGDESSNRCTGIRFLKVTIDNDGVFLTP